MPVETAQLPGTVSHSLSIIDLVGQSDIIVKLVLLLLLAASFWSWAVIFDKLLRLRRLRQSAASFEETFWSGGSLDDLFDRVGQRPVDPMSAANTALIGSTGRWPTRSNRSSSEPPDQKVSSKLAADWRKRLRRKSLSKITAHDQNEAASRSSSTSLTMMSDCPTRSMIERLWDTVPGSCAVSTGILGGPLWRHSGKKHELSL